MHRALLRRQMTTRTVVIEMPLGLLRLGDLMHEITSV